MKLLWILALIISVAGQGDIPAEGTELTVNEAYEDILSGDMQMKVSGTLLSTNPLTVTITRSAEGLNDEFCCANQCTVGNGETSEDLSFTPGGMANWYIHYTPTPGSNETITYLFSDGSESRSLTVHFDYTTQGIQNTDHSVDRVQKVLRDGILYIITDNKTYTIL